MDKKDSSKTVHSDSSERDPLFEAAARQFIADGYVRLYLCLRLTTVLATIAPVELLNNSKQQVS